MTARGFERNPRRLASDLAPIADITMAGDVQEQCGLTNLH
jgi:hypothetical protein